MINSINHIVYIGSKVIIIIVVCVCLYHISNNVIKYFILSCLLTVIQSIIVLCVFPIYQTDCFSDYLALQKYCKMCIV